MAAANHSAQIARMQEQIATLQDNDRKQDERIDWCVEGITANKLQLAKIFAVVAAGVALAQILSSHLG